MEPAVNKVTIETIQVGSFLTTHLGCSWGIVLEMDRKGKKAKIFWFGTNKKHTSINWWGDYDNYLHGHGFPDTWRVIAK